MTATSGRLFDGAELGAWLQERRKQCADELARIPVQQVVEQPLESVAEPLLARYSVLPVVLQRDEWYINEVRETRVLGAGGLATARVRVHTGEGSPGYTASVHVPFAGDADLLMLRTTVRAGHGLFARVEGCELVFPFEWPRGEQPRIEQQMEPILATIESPYLVAQASEIDRFHNDLADLIRVTLTERRDGLLEAREYLDGLRITCVSTTERSADVCGPRDRAPADTRAPCSAAKRAAGADLGG